MGGTLEGTRRVTMPSRSSSRSVSVNDFCEIPPIARFSSPKRFAPLVRPFLFFHDGKFQMTHVGWDGVVRFGNAEASERAVCRRASGRPGAPQPTTSIDVSETRRLWGDQVCLWGAIASIILTDSFSDDECERYMDELFRAVAPGDRFILGFGDNVPTDASWPRIQQVIRFWVEHGDYPLA